MWGVLNWLWRNWQTLRRCDPAMGHRAQQFVNSRYGRDTMIDSYVKVLAMPGQRETAPV